MNKNLAASQAVSPAETVFTLAEHPLRYYWKGKPRPWYWVFTFWSDRWLLSGNFVIVKFGESGYEEAPYEISTVSNPNSFSFLVKSS